MSHKVGIWIDHKKAVIVSTSGDPITTKTLESDVGPHSRYSGRAGYPTSDGPQDGRGEKRYEERYGQHLDRYYDEVISQVGEPEALLISGPVKPSCNCSSVSAAPRRCPSVLSESRRRTS